MDESNSSTLNPCGCGEPRPEAHGVKGVYARLKQLGAMIFKQAAWPVSVIVVS